MLARLPVLNLLLLLLLPHIALQPRTVDSDLKLGLFMETFIRLPKPQTPLNAQTLNPKALNTEGPAHSDSPKGKQQQKPTSECKVKHSSLLALGRTLVIWGMKASQPNVCGSGLRVGVQGFWGWDLEFVKSPTGLGCRGWGLSLTAWFEVQELGVEGFKAEALNPSVPDTTGLMLRNVSKQGFVPGMTGFLLRGFT